jgi:hypothetical protein
MGSMVWALRQAENNCGTITLTTMAQGYESIFISLLVFRSKKLTFGESYPEVGANPWGKSGVPAVYQNPSR